MQGSIFLRCFQKVSAPCSYITDLCVYYFHTFPSDTSLRQSNVWISSHTTSRPLTHLKLLALFPISAGYLNLLDCMARYMGSKWLPVSSRGPSTWLKEFVRCLPNTTLSTMMQISSLARPAVQLTVLFYCEVCTSHWGSKCCWVCLKNDTGSIFGCKSEEVSIERDGTG